MRTRTINAKLIGGPMNGHTTTVPKGTETIRIGAFWSYTYGGRDGKDAAFVILPRSRAMQRAILDVISRTGKHPGIEHERRKPTPKRGRTDKRGQGARRRKEKAREGA